MRLCGPAEEGWVGVAAGQKVLWCADLLFHDSRKMDCIGYVLLASCSQHVKLHEINAPASGFCVGRW